MTISSGYGLLEGLGTSLLSLIPPLINSDIANDLLLNKKSLKGTSANDDIKGVLNSDE